MVEIYANHLGTRTYKAWTVTALCQSDTEKKKNNFNSSWYQEGISNALTLNSTKQYGSGVYNTAALDDSFPRRFRETFNISGNALKETPTLSLHSPKSKSTTFCYWIRRWLKPPLHVSGYFWIRNFFTSNFRPHASGEFGSESGYFLIHALQSGKKKIRNESDDPSRIVSSLSSNNKPTLVSTNSVPHFTSLHEVLRYFPLLLNLHLVLL